MTLSDLIAAFRTEAADQAEPPLWSDAEIAGYLADAESEACIRARLLFDESSPAVAVIGIDTAAWVALDPSIIDVTRAHLASSPGRLLGWFIIGGVVGICHFNCFFHGFQSNCAKVLIIEEHDHLPIGFNFNPTVRLKPG